jgi:hypothetical protein
MTTRKDKRLFARFDLDYADHPKIGDLSDAAFRAHVEMILYSRKYLTDGIIPKRIAKRVGSEVLSELCCNDPTAPSLIPNEDGSYTLHGYADMNETAEEVEERRQRNSANGSKGGRPPGKTGSVSDSGGGSGAQKKAETETETETETTSPNGEVSPRKRAHTIPESFSINERMRAWAADNAPMVDIDAKLPEFIDYWTSVGKAMKDWEATWRNGMRKQQGFAERDHQRAAPKQSKAAANAAEFRRLFGDGSEGSLPALDAGIGP